MHFHSSNIAPRNTMLYLTFPPNDYGNYCATLQSTEATRGEE